MLNVYIGTYVLKMFFKILNVFLILMIDAGSILYTCMFFLTPNIHEIQQWYVYRFLNSSQVVLLVAWARHEFTFFKSPFFKNSQVNLLNYYAQARVNDTNYIKNGTLYHSFVIIFTSLWQRRNITSVALHEIKHNLVFFTFSRRRSAVELCDKKVDLKGRG